MHRRRWLLKLAAGGCLASVPGNNARAAAEIGHSAPELNCPEMDGHAFDLAALRGKVVVVNFWATWCVPCRQEMPALDAFYRRYHDRGLEMIGMSADRPRDREEVLRAARNLAFPVAMLRAATTNGFGQPRSLPITFVIDRGGIVRAELRPDDVVVTEQSLTRIVVPLLSA